jgi:hypothetical protein
VRYRLSLDLLDELRGLAHSIQRKLDFGRIEIDHAGTPNEKAF